jgi:hypothetical protein
MVLVFGVGNVISAISEARDDILPHSPWTIFGSGGIRNLLSYGYDLDFGSLDHAATIGAIAVLVVAAVAVMRDIRLATPMYVIAGALLAYLFVSVYTSPWFAAWVIPLVALHWRWRVSLCTLGFFALVTIDDRFGAAVTRDTFFKERTVQVLLSNWINTLTMVAAVASVVVLLLSRPPARTSPAPAAAELNHVPA